MLYASKIIDRHLGEQQLIEMAAFYTRLRLTLTSNNGYDVRIVLDPANENYVMEDGALFTADEKTLVKYTMDAPADYMVPDGVETIAAKGMVLVSKLESVTLPESVTTLGSYLFLGSSIERMTLGHGLTTIHNNAFESAQKLEYVFISNTVTEFGSRAFRNTALTTVEFEADSKLETVGDGAFSACTKLESIQC